MGSGVSSNKRNAPSSETSGVSRDAKFEGAVRIRDLKSQVLDLEDRASKYAARIQELEANLPKVAHLYEQAQQSRPATVLN